MEDSNETTVPLYQSELATPTHRGRHVGFHGMALATGYALTGFIGFGCYYHSGSSFQWRFPFAVQLLPVLILLAGSVKLPESPRWRNIPSRSPVFVI